MLTHTDTIVYQYNSIQDGRNGKWTEKLELGDDAEIKSVAKPKQTRNQNKKKKVSVIVVIRLSMAVAGIFNSCSFPPICTLPANLFALSFSIKWQLATGYWLVIKQKALGVQNPIPEIECLGPVPLPPWHSIWLHLLGSFRRFMSKGNEPNRQSPPPAK